MTKSNFHLGKLKWLNSAARIFLILAILVSSLVSFALDVRPVLADKAGVCGTPGKDGPITSLAGVINSYYPGTASVSAGETSIPVGAPRAGGGPAISAGDLLLVVQMQGADIDGSNTNNYGNGVGNGGTDVSTVTYPTGDPDYAGGNVAANFSAGQYEYVVATGPVAGGFVPISSGLVNSYFYSNNTGGASQGQRRFQVIRVPQYSNATLSGTVTALRWDGSTGGLASFDVAGQLDWNGQSIDVSGLGFRGGGGRRLTGATGFNWWDFRTFSTVNTNGSKGEGYAGTPRFVNNNGALLDNGVEGYPNGSYGRGGAGNAGGGSTDGNPTANDQNSGGGGGGNGGYGGMGGNAWNSGLADGGYGGAPFPGSAPRLIMGGGGGAGTTNNGTGLPLGFSSSGAAGGGVVFVRSGTIVGTGSINANGASRPVRGDADVVLNDGGGGGGAGGSVVVIARNGGGSVGILTVTATGGNGGDNWPDRSGTIARHGPGGGGGGGFVYTSGVVAAASSVAGGLNGISTTANDPFGATPGGTGVLVTNIAPADIPTSISGANCVPVSLTTTKTTSTPTVVAGNTATYTITVSNATGAGGALGVEISDVLNTNFTYASTDSIIYSGNAERTSESNPTVGTGTPTWGTFLIPGGGSVSITFTVNVDAATPPGTYQNPATATFLDPVRTTETGSLTSSYDPTSSTGEDVTITDQPSAIDAVDDTDSTIEGTPVTTSVLTNDDLGTQPTTITGSTNGTNGTVTCTATECTYTPNAGFTGIDTYTYTITDSDGNTDTATVTVTVNSANFTITKVVTGVDISGNGVLDNPGEVIEYQIEVVNTGIIDLTGVVVSDPLLQGTNGTFSGPTESLSTNSILNVGETWTYTGTYTVQQTDFDNNGGGDGDIDNTATADTNETTPQTASASVPIVNQPRINVLKTVTDVTFETPQVFQITYSLLVENTGDVILNNIQVVDDLTTTFPAPASFDLISLFSGTFSVNTGYDGNDDGGVNPTHINLLNGTDTLVPGASGVITLVVRVDTGDLLDETYINTADARGTPPSGPDVTSSSSVPGPDFIDPALTKAVDPALAAVGDLVTFTIIVTNNGTVPADGVVVTDPLPDNFDYISATSVDAVTSAPRGTITLIPPRTVQIDIGTVGVDDVILITILTRVNDLGQPPIRNEVTLVADDPPQGVAPDPTQNNTAAVIIQIRVPGGVRSLPATGFAPGKITMLPDQTVKQAYADLGDLWLEIPGLGVEASIVGVPRSGDAWNVDWLWEQTGWLQGSAFPTWQGNSIVTGHVYLPNGQPGPFVDLSNLRWGNQVIVHAFGQRYIYEVRTNHIVMPDDMSVLKHEEKAWLTLLTCRGYDDSSDTYRYRVEIRAVLMRVEAER